MSLQGTAGTDSGDQPANAGVGSGVVGDTSAATASGGTQSGVPDSGADPSSGAAAPQEPDLTLIPEEEFQKLVEKGDPRAIHKEMNRSYTQKMRELAEQRKSLPQEAQAAVQLVQMLRQDPHGTVEKLMSRLPPKPGASKADQAQQATDKVFERFAEVLGEDSARQLLPAIKHIADQAVAPIRQEMQLQAAREAEVLSNAAVDGLTSKYPDWKKHEPKMMEMARKLNPSDDMSEDEYLETLYHLANRDQAVADKTAEHIDRIKKSAKASETPAGTVAPGKVNSRPPGKRTSKEAYEAAKRGEKWD